MQKFNSLAKPDNSMFFEITGFGLCSENDKISQLANTEDFSFLYYRIGEGEIQTIGHTYHLSAGDFIICRPFEVKTLIPLSLEPYEFYWATLSGRFVPDVLTGLGITTEHKHHIGNDNEVSASFEKILSEVLQNLPKSDIIITATFISALGLMARRATDTPKSDKIKGYDKISPALDAINSDCTDRKGVEEYAKMCNLSSSYFTHLFTRIIGFSPMEYKQLRRIDIAKKLLITTRLSIKEISTIIGFKDPLYFGRCFKQAVGKSPSQFRMGK